MTTSYLLNPLQVVYLKNNFCLYHQSYNYCILILVTIGDEGIVRKLVKKIDNNIGRRKVVIKFSFIMYFIMLYLAFRVTQIARINITFSQLSVSMIFSKYSVWHILLDLNLLSSQRKNINNYC